MRNLLILITLCALSLPKISYASELSECKGSPSEVDSKNDTYKELRNSWTNCSATVTFTDGRKYVAEFKDGKLSGQGTYTFSSGAKYIGEFKDGKPHGQGTFTFANGDKYIGEWKDDKRHGQGTFTSTDGSKYVGEYKDSKYHGQGTYTWADGEKYVGEWKDSKYHGQGTFTFANGDKYIGEWKDSKYHGQGTFTSTDGEKYVGEWKDNKRHGQGTFTSTDGSKYVGEYKDSKYHGQGTYTWADGRKYVGGFKDDNQHGQGTYTYSNGDIYEGDFLNGKRYGYGVHYENELSKVTATMTINGSTHAMKNNTVSHRWSYMPVKTIYHVNTNDIFLRCLNNKVGEKLHTNENGSPVIMILLQSYKINKKGYVLSFHLDDYNLGCGDVCTQIYLTTTGHNDLYRKINKNNLDPLKARLSSGIPIGGTSTSMSYTKRSDPNEPVRLFLDGGAHYLDRKNLQLYRSETKNYQCKIEPSLEFWMFAGKMTNKFIEQEQKILQQEEEDASKNKI